MKKSHYNTLKITKSYRGISFIIFTISSLIPVLYSVYSATPMEKLAPICIGAIISLVMALFVKKGHRWAIVLIMFLFTADKGYAILKMHNGFAAVIVLFFWFFITRFFWRALQVENVRNLAKTESRVNEKKKIMKEKEVPESERWW